MNNYKKSYSKKEWFDYSEKVIRRDNYKCLKCHRKRGQVVLQTHHTIYKEGYDLWDYPLSDCITLCKGCHAVEHHIIEPTTGWTLIEIGDLGGLIGECEREGCGASIRYEHNAYHPLAGYKIVGSTCIEFMTRRDQNLSEDVINLFKKISSFVTNSVWEAHITRKLKHYVAAKHNHHQIRVYGRVNFAIQIALKVKGERWYDYQDIIKVSQGKSLSQAKELGFIVLKGLMAKSESEKELLRDIYIKSR